MSLFEVQHQPRAHRVLQRALASRRMPHAYLFVGPEGVGREMLAVRLAKLLLCEAPTRVDLPADVAEGMAAGEGLGACGRCDDCQLVEAGTHPDLTIVHRHLNREHPDPAIRRQKALMLSVDVVRHFLIERVGRRPMRNRAKVFIVREAERMNDSAQNSLLKTLEEPPEDTFVIVVTTALDRMLPTTKSRCQPVMFQPLPAGFVTAKLSSLRPSASVDERAYAGRQSGGSLGTASRLIEDGLYDLKRNWGEQMLGLLKGGGGYAPHLLAGPFLADAKTLGKQAAERDPEMSDTDATRSGLQVLLAALAAFYVDAERQATGAQVEPINADQLAVVAQLARRHTPSRLIDAVQQIAAAETAIGRNAAVELTLETMFIQLAALAQGRHLRRAAV